MGELHMPWMDRTVLVVDGTARVVCGASDADRLQKRVALLAPVSHVDISTALLCDVHPTNPAAGQLTPTKQHCLISVIVLHTLHRQPSPCCLLGPGPDTTVLRR